MAFTSLPCMVSGVLKGQVSLIGPLAAASVCTVPVAILVFPQAIIAKLPYAPGARTGLLVSILLEKLLLICPFRTLERTTGVQEHLKQR